MARKSPATKRSPTATRSPVIQRSPTATRSPVIQRSPTATRSPVTQRSPTTTRSPLTQRSLVNTRSPASNRSTAIKRSLFFSKIALFFCLALAVIIIVSVIFTLFIANWASFARPKVAEYVILKNGTLGMERFQNTSDLRNLRLSISVFNVTNADDVVNSGAKIRLKELGPFVYDEFKWKELLDNNQETGLITYKLRRRFVFNPKLSARYDPKRLKITWPNVPVLSLISVFDRVNDYMRPAAKYFIELLMKHQETPFITDTVDNFIFAGSSRKLFISMHEYFAIRTAILYLTGLKRWPLPDNKFAILYNRNNTWLPGIDHNFTIAAGFGPNQLPADLNQFKLMDGSPKLTYWGEAGQCNHLGGTDGQFFAPSLNYTDDISIYSMDICRKLHFKFRKITQVTGVTAYKYTLDEKSLQSPARNPENACYCMGNDYEECKLDGLVNLSTCAADNVYASGSHFFNGSPKLSTRLAGLRPPNRTLDEPTIYTEPNTGFAIKVNVPIQFNVKLERSDFDIVKFFQDPQPLYIPLLIITEAAELEEDQASLLLHKLILIDPWMMSMVMGGAIILVLVLLISITIFIRSRKRKRRRSSKPNDRSSLLRRGKTRH